MGNGKRREEKKQIATAREKKSLAGRTMQSKKNKGRIGANKGGASSRAVKKHRR